MVLELHIPRSESLRQLQPLVPVFLSYTLSFFFVGIYWNNHHHMLNACTAVTGATLWANLHLLFWLSLFPFVAGWMGENHFTGLPTSLYAGVLLMAAIAYYLLQQSIIHAEGPSSILKRAVDRDWKGKLSPGLYLVAIVAAPRFSWIAQAVLAIAALIWLVPDRRIERRLATSHCQAPDIGDENCGDAVQGTRLWTSR
jgi:uncharacterized membrane protein